MALVPTAWDTTVTCAVTNTSSQPIRIGANGGNGEVLNGLVDDVRVYNRVLTAAEIQTDMVTREFANAPEKAAMLKQKIPMGRTGTVEEIAAAVLWLCSEQSSYVTGATLSVDGGFVV